MRFKVHVHDFLIPAFPFSVNCVLRSKALKVHTCIHVRLGAPCNGSRSKVITWRVGMDRALQVFFSEVKQLPSFVRGYAAPLILVGKGENVS
jgi:hypothetical protein